MRIVLALLFLSLCGCTHSQIMQGCNRVVDDSGEPTGMSVCKTIKPWD